MERDKFAINLFKILQVMSCLFDKLLNLGFTWDDTIMNYGNFLLYKTNL